MIFSAQCTVVATTLLFHMLLVQTILPGWNFSIAWGNVAAVAVPSEMDRVCGESSLVCWQGDTFEPSAFNPYIRDQVRARIEMLKSEPIAELGTTFGSDNDLVSNGTMAVLVYKKGSHFWVIGDSRYGVRAHTVILRSFYILCAAARSVWLFGALGLLWFHKRRFARGGLLLIDFETVHRTYLKGSMDEAGWSFNPVNPAKPRTGRHLSTHQVFSNAGLGVALYLRNDFEAGRAIKVHVGLKLVFSRKVKGTFLLQDDMQKSP